MAGFLNKANQVAQQALDEAKKGVETGQAKLDDVQAKREASRILSILGAAHYAEQRSGGARSDVEAALKTVDEFVAQNGTDGFPTDEVPAGPPASTPAPAPSPTPTPTAPASPQAPAGGSAYDLPPTS
ncbi:MAG: hypothetical protein LH630_05415 [Actinomycetia bacterium]|nr:hypothetical protein [Actinomycetes bacterium]